MTAEQLKSIEDKLIRTCEWVQKRGWRITSGGYGNPEDNTCCALGAQYVRDGYSPTGGSYGVLGLTIGEEVTIGYAFDGNGRGEREDPDLHAIGARLRARFIP